MTRVTSRPRLLLAVALGLAVLLIGETVVLAATTIRKGGPVRAVNVATETAIQSISSTTPVDVQGMSLSVTIPAGEKALLLITFSAESLCRDFDEDAHVYCVVRVTVDGNPALPSSSMFDSSDDGDSADNVETNSMQFVAGPKLAGVHTIKVQAYLQAYSGSSEGSFYLLARTLSVLSSKA